MKYVKPMDLYRECLNVNRGRLLGVSVRNDCIRLAVSDADNKFATPSRDLAKRKIGVAELRTLQSLISTYSISGLVIGYPFERERALPTDGKQAKRFVDDLTETGKFEEMNYTLWDEALKSTAIAHSLQKFKLDTRALFEMLDSSSACDILQGYLDFLKRNQDQTTFVGEHGCLDFGPK